MSDADRLREAAEIVEITSYLNPQLEPTPGVLEKEAHERNAVAALLRAVAEEGDHDERISGFQLWPNTYDAALSLADTILGNEPTDTPTPKCYACGKPVAAFGLCGTHLTQQ